MPVTKKSSEPKMMTPTEIAKAINAGVTDVTQAAVTPVTHVAPTQQKEVDVAEHVSIQDRQEYIRSILGNTRFKKSYSLFNDTLTVTFQTRTVIENEQAKKAAERDAASEFTDVEKKQNELHYIYKMFHSLESLVYKSGQPYIHPVAHTPSETGSVFKTGEFFDMQDTVYYAVRKLFKAFEELCDKFYERATDADFWIKTGGLA